MCHMQISSIAAVLSALLLPGLAQAQRPGEDPSSTDSSTMSQSSAPPVEEAPGGGAQTAIPAYASALDGTGLISLDRQPAGHLLLGASTGGGWDSNPANMPDAGSSAFGTFSPYIGLQAVTPTLRALLQYQYTYTGFGSSYARQSMNIGSATVLGSINERWSWDLKAMASYGQDSIRFLGAQQTVAVGEVPGTGPNSASYLLDAGTVTYVDGGAGVSYRRSERDRINLHASNLFTHYTGLDQSNGVTTVAAEYERDVRPSLGAIAYAQSSMYYGALHCQSYGAGVGVRWKPNVQTSISLSGGPQLDSSGCGSQQGFSYSASLSTRLTGRSQLYLLSSREPTTSYLGPGLWQESASGGYQREVATHGTFGVDLGYVASDTLASGSSYHGTYFDVIYGHRLGHGLQASYSYRGYVGDSGGTGLTRNVAQFSLAWTPGAGHIFQ